MKKTTTQGSWKDPPKDTRPGKDRARLNLYSLTPEGDASWRETQSPARGLLRQSLALWRPSVGCLPTSLTPRWYGENLEGVVSDLSIPPGQYPHIVIPPRASHRQSRLRNASQPPTCLAEIRFVQQDTPEPGCRKLSIFRSQVWPVGLVHSVSGGPRGAVEEAGKQFCACPLPIFLGGRGNPSLDLKSFNPQPLLLSPTLPHAPHCSQGL